MADTAYNRRTRFLKVNPDSVLAELLRCRDLIQKEEIQLLLQPGSEPDTGLNNIQATWQKIAELCHQVLERQDFGGSVHPEIEEPLAETDGKTCPHCHNSHLAITFTGEIVCRDCYTHLSLSRGGKLSTLPKPGRNECPNCHQQELEIVLSGLAFCKNCNEDVSLAS